MNSSKYLLSNAKIAVKLRSLALDQKKKGGGGRKKVHKKKKIEINVVNTNRWFIGNPQSIFQKDLTDFIVMRHSEEEMV